jgi:hypothetical protein
MCIDETYMKNGGVTSSLMCCLNTSLLVPSNFPYILFVESKNLIDLDLVMKKSANIIAPFNCTFEELQEHYPRQKRRLDAEDALETAYEKGFEQGIAEGREMKETEEEIARFHTWVISRGVKMGIPAEEIAEIMNLTIEEVYKFIK